MSQLPRPYDLDPELKDLIHRKVPRLLRRAGDGAWDRDDIEQELTARLLAKLKASPGCAVFPRRAVNQAASNIARQLGAKKRGGGAQASHHRRAPRPAGEWGVLANLIDHDRRRPHAQANAVEMIDLREAIASLPAALRRVAELLTKGKTTAEIAIELGVTVRTVRRRVRKLIGALREEYFSES